MGILPPLIDYMTKKIIYVFVIFAFYSWKSFPLFEKMWTKMQITHGTIFMTDLSGCLNKHSHCVFLSIETR